MALNDYGKLALLLTSLVTGAVCIVLGIVLHEPEAITVGVGIVGPVVGYVTGNGVLAARGQAPSPVYVPDPARLAKAVQRELEATASAESDQLAGASEDRRADA